MRAAGYSHGDYALRRAPATKDFAIALWICTVTTTILAYAYADMHHWFVVPVVCCGALVGADAVLWARGRMDPLDPAGVLGILGLHFFMAAPFLHVIWDVWMRVPPPPDWRDWLGVMAILNAIGLVLYQVQRRRVVLPPAQVRQAATLWKPNRTVLLVVGTGMLILTGALQYSIYSRFGGVLGYIAGFESGAESFVGMGWLFMISESFPIIAFMMFAVLATERLRFSRSWIAIVLVLILFFAVKLLFGGLRGSRSNTIWGLFWAVGIIHLWVRPIPRKLVLLGLPVLVGFMYAYGFYKAYGSEATRALQGSEQRQEMSVQSRRGPEETLLGDLGRADVQAFLLYRISDPESEYRLRWGATYAEAFAFMVPNRLWPNRPLGKVDAGTEAQYGKSSTFKSSRVYGLSGEGMLNFGPYAVPWMFLFLAAAVNIVRRWLVSWPRGDIRLLVLPVAIIGCFLVLGMDLDNLLFFFIKHAFMPIVLIIVAHNRVSVPVHSGSQV